MRSIKGSWFVLYRTLVPVEEAIISCRNLDDMMISNRTGPKGHHPPPGACFLVNTVV